LDFGWILVGFLAAAASMMVCGDGEAANKPWTAGHSRRPSGVWDLYAI